MPGPSAGMAVAPGAASVMPSATAQDYFGTYEDEVGTPRVPSARQREVGAEVRDLHAAARNPDTPTPAFEEAKKRYIELRDGLEPEVAEIVDPAFGVDRKPPRGRKRGKITVDVVFPNVTTQDEFVGAGPDVLPMSPRLSDLIHLTRPYPTTATVTTGLQFPHFGATPGPSPGMGMLPASGPSVPLEVAPGAPPVIQGPPEPGPRVGPAPGPIPHRGPSVEMTVEQEAEELIAAARHPEIPPTAYQAARQRYLEIREELQPSVREVGDVVYNVRPRRRRRKR